MSSKKILAASLAAVLATSSVAAVAMADDTATNVATDDYTLELLPGSRTVPGAWSNMTAHVSATFKSPDLESLLAPDVTIPVAGGAAATPVPANRGVLTLANYKLPSNVDPAKVVASGAGTGTNNNVAAGEYAWIDSTGTILAPAGDGSGLLDLTAFTDVTIDAGITNGVKLIKVSKEGSSADGSTVEGAEYSVVASFGGFGAMEDEANPYNKLAMGLNFKQLPGRTDYVVEWDDFSMSGITMTIDMAGKGDNTKLAAGGVEVDENVDRAAHASVKFGDIKGASTAANRVGVISPTVPNRTGTEQRYVTEPKAMKPSFGISSDKTLTSIDYDNSYITLDFDISMSNDHWYLLLRQTNLNWDEVPSENWWNNLDFENVLKGNVEEVLATFLGLEGSSVIDWAVDLNNKPLQVNGIDMSDVSDAAVSDVKLGTQGDPTTEQFVFNPGVTEWPITALGFALGVYSYEFTSADVGIDVRYGITKQKVFQNLNNGGTVTFTFDKEFRPQDAFNPYLIFRTSGGLVNPPIDLEYIATSDDNKSITFSFPAGLTWDDGTTNPFKNFRMSYNLGYYNTYAAQANAGAMARPVDAAGNDVLTAYAGDDYASYFHTAVNPGHLVKITFKADGAAPSIDGGNNSNGGDTSNSGNNGGNTTNPGSTSGNPNTGIALAVAPVVLAAGAVVTLVSKKRK